MTPGWVVSNAMNDSASKTMTASGFRWPSADIPAKPWTRYFYQVIAAEISALARYYDRMIQLEPVSFDDGTLFAKVACPEKLAFENLNEMPDVSQDTTQRTLVLLNGNLNFSEDIQNIFQSIYPKLARTSRLGVVCFNPYLEWLFLLMGKLKLSRSGEMTTFLTVNSLCALAQLSGYEMVRIRQSCYMPLQLFGLGALINKVMPAIPLLRWLSLSSVVIFRPVIHEQSKPSLSVVVPARNEHGHMKQIMQRLPVIPGAKAELIFIEGGSTDQTWETIQSLVEQGDPNWTLSAFQQQGSGKNDAVRLGFSKAKNDLLVILDADLTMPPELLPRFYDAYVAGHGDMINGNRLVYPMEGSAMRSLNILGNLFFAKALSRVLHINIGDSLCGTKMLALHDYKRLIRWRADFGDFDPFGDFELLFVAASLGLGTIDVPIPYKARRYGETNISRFRHGLILLGMVIQAVGRIQMGHLR